MWCISGNKVGVGLGFGRVVVGLYRVEGARVVMVNIDSERFSNDFVCLSMGTIVTFLLLDVVWVTLL
jgi:hypothetical protein